MEFAGRVVADSRRVHCCQQVALKSGLQAFLGFVEVASVDERSKEMSVLEEFCSS